MSEGGLEAEVESLRRRLADLESSLVGSSSKISEGSPFAPRPVVTRKEILDADASPTTSTRLPSVDVPKFEGDVEEFYKQFGRWMRLTGVCKASDRVKLDWVLMATVPKFRKLLEKICEEDPSWEQFWSKMELLFPKVENDISIRDQIRKLPALPKEPSPHEVEVLLMELNGFLSKMSPEAMSA